MYLVTGCAVYWVSYVKLLLKKNYKVLGIDNLNSYYSTKYKKFRISNLKKR